ncbi:MAG: MarR family transcriptional regulator [Acidobacteria bacterium]|nr:MarR family transcriptional regulator [Acidobacteriota bacterium]
MIDDGTGAARPLAEAEASLPGSAGPACAHLEPLLSANLLWFGRALTRRFDALLAKRGHGLTMAQARILFTLDGSGPITQKELAQRTEVEPPTIGRTIGILERQGLVRRASNPGDRRQRVVQLRAAGRRQIDQLITFFEETEAWLTRDIPTQRVRQLVTELSSLREQWTAESDVSYCGGPAADSDDQMDKR